MSTIVTDTQTLDFGKQYAGTRITKTVHITNQGENIRFAAYASGSHESNYQLDKGIGTLEKMTTTTITVTFSPVVEGDL